MVYLIDKYCDEKEDKWDEFVLAKSVNGSFLQTRKFLNYHPKDRFNDSSLMVYHKNHLVAVVPACLITDNNSRIFFSHKGSTFGGIILSKEYYKAERVIDIVKSIDDYVSEKYDKAIFKITPDIYSKENGDLLQYALSYCGYSNYVELNAYVDLIKLNSDVISSFDRNKIRNIRKCEKHDLSFRELYNNDEIASFHKLLEINLSKYGLSPVHTVKEMISFRESIIPNNVKFYGTFRNNEMMAGGMMFVFEQTNVIHAQNLSADFRFDEYSPITYMYYQVIRQAKEDGYDALSWGISTEDEGRYLNTGLIRNKESYGSRHFLNRTYYKEFRGVKCR